jgi:hypothetical protein
MNIDDFYRLIGLALLVAIVLNTRRAFTYTFLAFANFALYAFIKPLFIPDFFQSGTQVPQYVLGALGVFLLGSLLGGQFCALTVDRKMIDATPPTVTVQIAHIYLPALVGVALVVLHLALVGYTPLSAIEDPITVRWALGNGGNILFQSLWTNFLTVTAIYIFFTSAPLIHRLFAVAITLAWFPLLSIRAPLIEFVLIVIVIKYYLVNRRGISPFAGVMFAVTSLVVIASLGAVRLSLQTGKSFEELLGDVPNLFNVSGLMIALILQRLDYLNVLQAAESSLSQLQLPAIPFLYNLLPRGLFAEKLFSSDTQTTALAGQGFDEENITRIVGVVAEMMSSHLMLLFGVMFLFSLGVLYKLLDRRVRMNRGRLFLFARMLPMAGGLPLLGGWNTIYMSSFVLNLMMSALIVHLYEKRFPILTTDR